MAMTISEQADFDAIRRRLDQLEAMDPNAGESDRDRGERLHMEKNAPGVNGIYSHLRFPPYVMAEYPKMLYAPSYGAAKAAMDSAMRIPGRGTEDAAREQAIRAAQYQLTQATRIVRDAEDERMHSGTWFESPQLAEEARVREEEYVAQQAAESNWTDRNLIGAAKRERDAYDAEAEGHVMDVPAPKRSYTRRKKD